MNEKIKQLVEQTPYTIISTEGRLFSPQDLAKFAELIVRECITIANNVHMCRDGRPVAEDIKKQFGVEE